MMAGQRVRLRGEAIRAGLADSGRLGVFGLSHGGFATCWPVATSGRFKAGRPNGLTGRSMRPLAAETAEFPVSYASEEGMPFVRREPEDRPC